MNGTASRQNIKLLWIATHNIVLVFECVVVCVCVCLMSVCARKGNCRPHIIFCAMKLAVHSFKVHCYTLNLTVEFVEQYQIRGEFLSIENRFKSIESIHRVNFVVKFGTLFPFQLIPENPTESGSQRKWVLTVSMQLAYTRHWRSALIRIPFSASTLTESHVCASVLVRPCGAIAVIIVCLRYSRCAYAWTCCSCIKEFVSNESLWINR